MQAKLVVANWKMHGNLHDNQQLLSAYKSMLANLENVEIVVCVPYPYLPQTQSLLNNSRLRWGAQNVSKDLVGAFTGEVSASMLSDFGTDYVIVGHSDRATAYCESNENIATKFMQVKAHGMTPILCVGETLLEREAGIMERAVDEQLGSLLKNYGQSAFDDAVISYEPVWAIGTGLAASSEQAKQMHAFIRSRIGDARTRLLYGGSVNGRNAVELLAVENVDGALIGRCSLLVQEFASICEVASNLGLGK